jgi:putative transposase
LSQLGEIVRDEWLKTAEMRPEVELGEFVVMPNHFHAIIGLFDNAMLPMETGLQNLCDTPMQTGVCVSGVCDTPMQTGVCVSGVCDTPMQTGVCDTPLRSPAKTIGAIIRGFKSAVTGHARRKGLAVDIWQRNYYEHIIRNEESYRKIAGYIRNNAANWQEDEYFR